MFDAALSAQLRTHFTKLTRPVELAMSLDDSARSRQLAEFLGEVAAASDAITLIRIDDDARRPSFRVRTPGVETDVRFAGIPNGHEFTSLVLAVLQVGGHPPAFDAATAAAVMALDGEFHVETYLSLSCQNCPDVVQAFNAMAALNPNVHHTAIDGAAFADEAEARGVMAVPTVFVNGVEFGQGRMSVEQILAGLDTGAAQRQIDDLAAKPVFDTLVVGGGPAGATAAVYAARKGIRTGIAVERFGGQVLDTLAIENFVSVPATDGPKLAAALERHVGDYAVDVMHDQRATRLIPAPAPGEPIGVELANGVVLQARSVVVSTGARWRELGVTGETEYRTKGVTFCPHCDGPLFAGKRVAVVGGGNSGVEAAIDLAGVVAHVTLVEFAPELRADAVLQRKLRSLANVEVICGARTTEVIGDGAKVTGLRYAEVASDAVHDLALDGIFVQIGLLPNTDWLVGSDVALSERGEVVVDDRAATSVPGVFAAGDCTTMPYKQILTAMGSGATAALSAFDHLIRTSAPAGDAGTADGAAA